MTLDAVDLFLEVVRAGSFSGAARATGVPVSTVSQRIAALEARLGTALIKRTTRRLALTEAGAAYHAVAAKALAELRGFEAGLAGEAAGLSGRLRVASTAAMDDVLAPLISGYLVAYPRMAVELVLGGRNADLFAEDIDIAVRFGALRDEAGLVARTIGNTAMQLVAAPHFLAGRGPVVHPRDLDSREIISFSGVADAGLSRPDGETVVMVIEGRFSANQFSSLRRQAIAGLGIALLPIAFVADDLASGELTVVLPDWRTAAEPIHIVYLKQRLVPKRLRAFVDHLVAHFPRDRFAG